jgi:hypothetical protein
MMTSFESEERIMAVPLSIPQAFDYKGRNFYIRSCYDKYYNIIMDKLFGKSDYSYISVTGTPGIGKSMFYMYFLNRYDSKIQKRVLSPPHLEKSKTCWIVDCFEPMERLRNVLI